MGRPNLWVARSSSFLVQSFLTKFSLPHANLARRVVLIPAMANSLRRPQMSWVPVLHKSFLSRHTTASWRDTFLQAAANFRHDDDHFGRNILWSLKTFKVNKYVRLRSHRSKRKSGTGRYNATLCRNNCSRRHIVPPWQFYNYFEAFVIPFK
jgi:hypothetical protein